MIFVWLRLTFIVCVRLTIPDIHSISFNGAIKILCFLENRFANFRFVQHFEMECIYLLILERLKQKNSRGQNFERRFTVLND